MAVRSKCLVLPTLIGTAQVTRYTVPSDETALVKWLTIHNANAAAQVLSLFLDAGSGVKQVLSHSVGAAASVDLPLWWVLHPGWLLRSSASAGSSLTIALYGAELEGVAD